MKVVPPNFGCVEDGIYRCGLPNPRHYGFLSSLQLRTCVLLTDTPDPIFLQWLFENNIYVLCPLMTSGGRSGGALGIRSAHVGPVPLYKGGYAGTSSSPLLVLHPAPLPQHQHLHTAHHVLPTGGPPLVGTVGVTGNGYAFSPFPLTPASHTGPSTSSTAPATSSAVGTPGGETLDNTREGGGPLPSNSFSAAAASPPTHREDEEQEVEEEVEGAPSQLTAAAAPSSSRTITPLPSSVASSSTLFASGGKGNPATTSPHSTDPTAMNAVVPQGSTDAGGGSVGSFSPGSSTITGMRGGPTGTVIPPMTGSSSPSSSCSPGSTGTGDGNPLSTSGKVTVLHGSGAARRAGVEEAAGGGSMSTLAPSTNHPPASNGTNSGSSHLTGTGRPTHTSSSGMRYSPATTLSVPPSFVLGHPPVPPSPLHTSHFHPPLSYTQHPGVEYYYGSPGTTWIERKREDGIHEVSGEGSGSAVGGEGGDSMRSVTGWMTLSESVVVRILEVLLDRIHYPLLITCSKGRYRTGIVCACLRKMQRWNLVSILEEYRRFAGDKSRVENEEFIELFDTDLVSTNVKSGLKPSILY